MSWREQAKCRGMDVNIFHPKKGKSYLVEEQIKNVCYACPVNKQCLEDALSEYLQIGYRAGLSAKARGILIDEKKKVGAVPWRRKN